MKHMEERLDQKIAAVRTDSAHETAVVRSEMREMEERLTNRMYKTTAWTAGLVLTGLGIVTAILLVQRGRRASTSRINLGHYSP